MLPSELIFFIVSVLFRVRESLSSDTWYYSSSSPEDSDASQDIYFSTAPCTNQKSPEYIIKYLSTFENLIHDFTFDRLDKIYYELDSVETEKKAGVKTQLSQLKKIVTEKATEAKCPAPDDPSLMGEFDSLVDLIYEMCYINRLDSVRNLRESASERATKLAKRFKSTIETIQTGAGNASSLCFELIEDSKVEMATVKQLEDSYSNQTKILYDLCYDLAYSEAKKFMPSIVERATSCRTENGIVFFESRSPQLFLS